MPVEKTAFATMKQTTKNNGTAKQLQKIAALHVGALRRQLTTAKIPIKNKPKISRERVKLRLGLVCWGSGTRLRKRRIKNATKPSLTAIC
ncbi:MAG: hypothetical protein ACQCN6_12360 [Candidatus Bathyarchaeia archaeon]|jgi:hypothetical protein